MNTPLITILARLILSTCLPFNYLGTFLVLLSLWNLSLRVFFLHTSPKQPFRSSVVPNACHLHHPKSHVSLIIDTIWQVILSGFSFCRSLQPSIPSFSFRAYIIFSVFFASILSTLSSFSLQTKLHFTKRHKEIVPCISTSLFLNSKQKNKPPEANDSTYPGFNLPLITL